MESEFRVRCTPVEMRAAFSNEEAYNIRYYKCLGLKKRGDLDTSCLTDEEWDKLKDVKCLYLVRLRHSEYLTYLQGTYSSWRAVDKAIAVKEKELGDHLYAGYKKTDIFLWRRNNADEGRDSFSIVGVFRNPRGRYYAIKDVVSVSYTSESELGEVLEVICDYGYADIEAVKADKGEDTDGFIAECFFLSRIDDCWRKSQLFDTEEEVLQYVETNMLRTRF